MEPESTEIFDKLIKLLTDKSIEHKIMEHEPTLTSEDAAKVRGVTLASGAKAMLLKYEATKGSFLVFKIIRVVYISSGISREEDKYENTEKGFEDEEYEDSR